MRAYQFISEVDHKKIGLDIEPSDPRFPLYKRAILKHSEASRGVSNILHQLHRAENPKKILRRMSSGTEYQIRMLDDIMWNHPLKRQLTVYHGAKESPLRIWITKRVPLDQPIRVHLPAYTSTSTDLRQARNFSEFGDKKLKVLMRQYAPALLHTKYAKYTEYYNFLKIALLPGMPALSIKQHSSHPTENEVLLGRGVEIEIQPNPVIDDYSTIIWDCKVVYVNPREYWTD